ncbi:hypothetical protein Hte_003573 [Hypoxylon texense]
MAPHNQVLRTKTCEVCGVRKHGENFFLCDGCEVVWYCSNEHQESHRSSHEKLCKTIQDCKQDVREEDDRLQQSHGASVFLPPGTLRDRISTNPAFDNWSITFTIIGFLQQELIDALIQIPTTEAHHVALHHCQTMNLLEPQQVYWTNHLGVMLRLGQEQECYDLLKWSQINNAMAWLQSTVMNTQVEHADPLEMACSYTEGMSASGDFGQLSCLLLLHMRRLNDLMTLKRAAESLPQHLPQELVDMVKTNAVGAPLRGRRDILEREEHSQEMELLKKSMEGIYLFAQQRDPFFWGQFLHPNGKKHPTHNLHAEEVEMSIKFIRPLWEDTPIAFEFIQSLEDKTMKWAS